MVKFSQTKPDLDKHLKQKKGTKNPLLQLKRISMILFFQPYAFCSKACVQELFSSGEE